MKNPILKTEEQNKEYNIPQEAMHLLEILDQIENHTAELRKKLMEELKKSNAARVSLTLDSIKE
jgi:hypothetical protein